MLISDLPAPDKIMHDTAEMRDKIAAAKGEGGAWDAKLGAGRIQDIELFSQAACLIFGSEKRGVFDGLRAAQSGGLIDQRELEALHHAYERLWTVQIVAKLLSEKPLDPEDLGQGGQSFLLRETQSESLHALKQSLKDHSEAASNVIDRVLSGKTEVQT